MEDAASERDGFDGALKRSTSLGLVFSVDGGKKEEPVALKAARLIALDAAAWQGACSDAGTRQRRVDTEGKTLLPGARISHV